jgi:5-methylcytosine-specific restriction protein A
VIAHACPVCGDSVRGAGRCTKCARPENQRKNTRATYTTVYGTPRWRELRLKILTRDRFTCQECGGKANSADHIKPFTDATDPLAWQSSNLQSMCQRCHGRKDGARAA